MLLSGRLKLAGYICECAFAPSRSGGTSIPAGPVLCVSKVGLHFRRRAESECGSRTPNRCSRFDVQVWFIYSHFYALQKSLVLLLSVFTKERQSYREETNTGRFSCMHDVSVKTFSNVFSCSITVQVFIAINTLKYKHTQNSPNTKLQNQLF